MKHPFLHIFSSCLLLSCSLALTAADLKLTAIPEDTLPEQYPFEQQEKPGPELKENPFVETAPRPVPTPAEQNQKMIIFTRPLTAPVWAETNPLPEERATRLTGWGAPGQFVLLNFGIHPLANLTKLKIRTESALQPELTRVGYWKIRYPNYNSRTKEYRRMPEYMVPMTVCNAPAHESQRFILSFRLPADCPAGIHRGLVRIWHSASTQATTLPFQVQVLPIRLKKDPDRHYTAYYYSVRERGSKFHSANKNNPAVLHQRQLEEYRQLRDFGFTCPPSTLLRYTPVKDYLYVAHLKEIREELLEAGFKPDAPIFLSGSGEWYFIPHYTGKAIRTHYPGITDMPEAYFEKMDALLAKFKKESEANHYPPFLFNPVDEPSVENLPWLKRLYALFHKHGLRTVYTSASPEARAHMNEGIDIYNDGCFRYSYETIQKDTRKEYWAYPNNVAYQIKKPEIMCHNGRMTYGFGFWRSGYQRLMPWVWRLPTEPAHLKGKGGNLMLPDGRVLVGLYWACFREGIYDLNYLYTLMDAAAKRKDSSDPQCRQLIKQAGELLQQTWNDIPVQSDYSAGGIFPHEEYDARRLQFAQLIMKLNRFPETSPRNRPVFIPAPTAENPPAAAETDSQGYEVFRLKNWKPMEQEAAVTEKDNIVHMLITVDHQHDGTVEFNQSTKYKCGWPRMVYRFPANIFSDYQYLDFKLKVDSNNDGEANEWWPMWMNARQANGKTFSLHQTSALQPSTWHEFRIPLDHDKLKNIAWFQFGISENQYRDKARLNFLFKDMKLLKWKNPTPANIICPALCSTDEDCFSLNFDINGPLAQSDQVRISLLAPDNRVLDKKIIAPSWKNHLLVRTDKAGPGIQRLRIQVLKNQKTVSEKTRTIRFIPAISENCDLLRK